MPKNTGKGIIKKRKCVKPTAYPCKSTCINEKKNCRNPLEGQAKTAVEWATMQQARFDAINKKRTEKGRGTLSVVNGNLVKAQASRLSDRPIVAKPKVDLPDPKTPIALDELKTVHARLRSGDITAAELKNAWERFKNSKDAIKAEINKMTIAQIKKEFPQWRENKKEEYVRGALNVLRDRFRSDSMLSFDPFDKGSEARAYDRSVDAWTDEKIAESARQRKELQQARLKALTNPETLKEFDYFVDTRGESKLTPEQLTKYDELRAQAGREVRSRIAEAQKEGRKPEVKESASTDSGIDVTLHQTKHSKQGHDLHVVKIGDRVEREVYNDLLREAKGLGGYYSAYSRDGAIPGFQFRTVENAKAFMEKAQAKLGKDVTPVNKQGEAIAKPSTEEDPTPKTNPVADKLRGMAEKLKEDGENELSRDRLANTARRARMAGNAIEGAQKKIALAKTMSNLADAIENNDVRFIDKLANKTDVKQLEGLLSSAQYNAYRNWEKENPNAPYSANERERERDPRVEDIAFARYPYPRPNVNWLQDVVDIGRTLKGHTLLANRIEKKIKTLPKKEHLIEFKYPSEIDDLRKLTIAVKKSKHRDAGRADYIAEDIQDYDRLQRMGITNDVELRAALREFMQYRDGASTQLDPIKAAELALAGRKFDGYFPTPKGLADRLVDEADIQPGMKVLEPSAGKGSLLDAIKEKVPDADLHAIEPVTPLYDLVKAKGYNVEQGDFMQHKGQYDRIIMNPPFEKQQDIDHVRHAFDQLKPGGRLVAITSESPFFTQNKKAADFRDFVDQYGISEKLPEGSFKSSDRSTGVATRIVILDKPDIPKKDKEAIAKPETPKQPELTPEQKAVENKYEEIAGLIGRPAKTYNEIKELANKTPYEYLKEYSPKLAEEFKQYAERSGYFWKDTRTGHSFNLSDADKKDLRALDTARIVLKLPIHETPDGKPKPEPTQPKDKLVEDTPRAIAAKETETEKDDYAFARKSAVPNAGEDLLGSARHIRNQWKSLAEAEKDGTAQELVTRQNLLKNEPSNFMATIDNAHALSHLAGYLALNAFPPIPFKNDDYYFTGKGDRKAEFEKQLREQYYNAYQKIKKLAEEQAQSTTDPYAVLKTIHNATATEIQRLRNETNPYNPVANGLVSLYKATYPRTMSRYRGREIGAKIDDFKARVKKAYGDTNLDSDNVTEHASKIIEGKSFNESFGTVGSKEGQFNPADAYVKKATRTGGRVINASTVETGTKFLINDIGLRGVQYGNSVTDEERIHHLQKSSEALADLADITGLPDSAISLKGTLGLAIGARGKGNALAHYEPGNKVINLTRKSGVGSLAHEWGHALDNFIAGGGASFTSKNYWRSGGNDPVANAMRDVSIAMDESGFSDRLYQATRDKGMSSKKAEYWRSPEEKFARTFERFIQDKLEASDRENTYLAGVSKIIDPLWPTKEEVKKIAPAMEKLLEAIKEKHFS